MTKTLERRLSHVRNAVAEAAEGLSAKDYRELMENLLADAEGWKMELDEMEDKEDA